MSYWFHFLLVGEQGFETQSYIWLVFDKLNTFSLTKMMVFWQSHVIWCHTENLRFNIHKCYLTRGTHAKLRHTWHDNHMYSKNKCFTEHPTPLHGYSSRRTCKGIHPIHPVNTALMFLFSVTMFISWQFDQYTPPSRPPPPLFSSPFS